MLPAMAALKDCLRLEARHADEIAGQLGDFEAPVDAIVWLCFQVAETGPGINHKATTSLSRLLVDSAVHVEQAFVSVVRGQPRLGWTAMRLAAEALKDLVCIEQHPPLHELWLNLARSSTEDEVQAAKAAFQAERKNVRDTPLTQVCMKTMSLCNHFGAHPNGGSWATLGPTKPISDDHMSIPPRLTDATMVRWHVQHMLVHAVPILDALAQFRARYLLAADAAELLRKRDAALRTAWPLVEAVAKGR